MNFITTSRAFLITPFFLFACPGLFAQTYSKGHETARGEINFTELANYYAAHPSPAAKKTIFNDEDEGEENQPYHPPADPSLVHLVQRRAARTVDNTIGNAITVSIAPSDTFLATSSNGSFIPPDTHGAVDSNYCVTTTNYSVHIQTRTGINVSNLTLNNFWTSMLGSGSGAFDPRVHYDPYYKRWIIVTLAYGQTTNAQIMVAVSKTGSPTAGWWMYKVNVGATGGNWLDFPNVGFNNKWIVVTGNLYSISGGSSNGSAVYVFNYANMMAGTGAPYTKITQSSSFTLCPALTYDATEPSMFVGEIWNSGAGQLRLSKITGPVGSPVMTAIGYPATTQHWHGSQPGGNDFGPQLGTSNRIDEGDNRLTTMTFRNGNVWCAHTVFLPSSGTANRSSIMWWQIDTTAVPIQNGMVNDPTAGAFYAYPSIAVNKNNDVLIGCSRFSSTAYPSAAYALRLHTYATDTIGQPYIFRHGKANYYQTFGGGKNRWGDYSGTCVDPRNDVDFWTVQESVPTAPANYWDTWWAHVPVCPAFASFSLSADTINILVRDTITFNGSAPAGTTYAWSFGGGIAVPGTGAGPQVVTWGATGMKGVVLTVSDGTCSTTFTDSVLVTNTAAVNDVNKQGQGIKVIPNPNAGTFDLMFDNPVVKPVAVRITDMQGREVYYHEFKVINGNKISVVTENISSGLYVAEINIDGVVVKEKILINR
jgi:hypothetical protein